MEVDVKEKVSKNTFATKVLIACGIIIPIILILFFFAFAFQVLLLILAGVLIAVFFRGIASFLFQKFKLPMKWSVPLSVVGILSIIVGVSLLIAPSISKQAESLEKEIPKSIDQLRKKYSDNAFISDAFSSNPDWGKVFQGQGKWAKKTFGVIASTLGVLADIYVIFFIGLFFTFSPQPFIDGIVKIFPIPKRDRTREVLDSLGETLKKWLLAKLLSMAIVGILTTIGLFILGIPLALVLGLIAGLLSFIPNFGPIISLAPAALLALTQGNNMAIYVVLLYVGVQALESNLITPFIQKNMVDIPMALVLIAQVTLGVFSNGLGLILATPIVLIFIVLIKMLYIKDVLGDNTGER